MDLGIGIMTIGIDPMMRLGLVTLASHGLTIALGIVVVAGLPAATLVAPGSTPSHRR